MYTKQSEHIITIYLLTEGKTAEYFLVLGFVRVLDHIRQSILLHRT